VNVTLIGTLIIQFPRRMPALQLPSPNVSAKRLQIALAVYKTAVGPHAKSPRATREASPRHKTQPWRLILNALAGKPVKVAMSAALMAAVFFALPVKMDAQHPLGFSAALAGSRHDSASPF
jgi:hypothetical protein